MILLDQNDGVEAIETELDIFREALFALSSRRIELSINRLCEDMKAQEGNGKEVHLNALALYPEAIDHANIVLTYLQGRDFFFKERSRFVALCGELNTDTETIRDQLRQEELAALTDGGLDEINLYQYRDVLTDVVCKIDGRREAR